MAKATKASIKDHEFFMAMAVLTSKYSEDPVTKVGAVIVNSENCIVGIGYNDFPKHLEFNWDKKEKMKYVVHAEKNAIIHRNCDQLKNATIYTTLSPCIQCSKLIIKSGITKVIYMNYKPGGNNQYKDALLLLKENGVKYKELSKKININFKQPSKLKYYFMSIANLASKYTKESDKTGAVMVNEDNQIVAIGYNDFPLYNLENYHNNTSEDTFLIYAIDNAILNAKAGKLKNTHLYITRYPCNECARLIVETGIKKIYYLEEFKDEASELMFSKEKITVEKYTNPPEFTVEVEKKKLKKLLQRLTNLVHFCH